MTPASIPFAEGEARLDWRERDYERVDITELTSLAGPRTSLRPNARIQVYVPRPSAIERYEVARDSGRAAVRRSYWELVARAFAELGDDHAERYARTPPPDVPVADIALHPFD